MNLPKVSGRLGHDGDQAGPDAAKPNHIKTSETLIPIPRNNCIIDLVLLQDVPEFATARKLVLYVGKFALRPARRLGGVILSGTNKNGRNVAGKRGTDGNPTTQVVLQTLYARLASKLYGLCKDRGCSATCRQRAVIKSNAKSKLTGLPICILQSRCFPAPSCLTSTKVRHRLA